MRKGFTLIECMIAGAVLVLVVTTFMMALSVINRVEHENAQFMEADAILWDALAREFNREYEDLYRECEENKDSSQRNGWEKDVQVCSFPATLTVDYEALSTNNHEWILISAEIKWRDDKHSLSNVVLRSEYARRGEDDE